MRTSEDWVDFTVLPSNFVCFGVFDQLNLLIYCGNKVNGSKEKPSRFLSTSNFYALIGQNLTGEFMRKFMQHLESCLL